MANLEVTRYFKPGSYPHWSRDDWKEVEQIRTELNLPTLQEQLQYLEERRRSDENRARDKYLFMISLSDDVSWPEFEAQGNDETTENRDFVGKSRLLLLLARNPKVSILVILSPIFTFLIITLVVFVIGVLGVGSTPFEFCARPLVKTASDVETKYADAFAFGEYLKSEVPELTNEQIYGLLGNVAIESSDAGTRAYQGYYMDTMSEQIAKLRNGNAWWITETQNKSAHAVGLIQWDPASKLIEVAIAEGVHWTNKNLQFKQALAYFKGRSQWSEFLVTGNTTAYYAELGMKMEGCQIGANGCTASERATSALQFSGYDFANSFSGNACSGYSAGGWTDPLLGHISSSFGARFHPIYKIWRDHNGTDLVKPVGGTSCDQNIYAANGGEVIAVAYNGGAGNHVNIQHPNNMVTKYFHMPDINGSVVNVGDQVTAGQLIGHVGTTGASTGCHLHFELHINGVPTDSVPFFMSFGVDLNAN